jgi:hypothetical protein
MGWREKWLKTRSKTPAGSAGSNCSVERHPGPNLVGGTAPLAPGRVAGASMPFVPTISMRSCAPDQSSRQAAKGHAALRREGTARAVFA